MAIWIIITLLAIIVLILGLLLFELGRVLEQVNGLAKMLIIMNRANQNAADERGR